MSNENDELFAAVEASFSLYGLQCAACGYAVSLPRGGARFTEEMTAAGFNTSSRFLCGSCAHLVDLVGVNAKGEEWYVLRTGLSVCKDDQIR
jgi:hypothetical protein